MARRRDSKRSGDPQSGSNRRLPRPHESVLLDSPRSARISVYRDAGRTDRGMGRSPITARFDARISRQRPPTTTPLKAAVSRVYPVVRPTPRPRPVSGPISLARFYQQVPRSTRMCVARAERKEVLFAAGVAGKGKRKSKGPYKFTSNSKVRCK